MNHTGVMNREVQTGISNSDHSVGFIVNSLRAPRCSTREVRPTRNGPTTEASNIIHSIFARSLSLTLKQAAAWTTCPKSPDCGSRLPGTCSAGELNYSLTAGAGTNFDICLNLGPYLMKSTGIGRARQEIPPKILEAGPTPRFRNIGRAAKGSPHASNERRKVFAAMALAA